MSLYEYIQENRMENRFTESHAIMLIQNMKNMAKIATSEEQYLQIIEIIIHNFFHPSQDRPSLDAEAIETLKESYHRNK